MAAVVGWGRRRRRAAARSVLAARRLEKLVHSRRGSKSPVKGRWTRRAAPTGGGTRMSERRRSNAEEDRPRRSSSPSLESPPPTWSALHPPSVAAAGTTTCSSAGRSGGALDLRRSEPRGSHSPSFISSAAASLRCDLLSRFISSSSSGAADHSDEFLRDFCINFILAGRDTSSVALVWFFWLLAGHPDVEARVLEDVRAARGDVKKMDYLHAALTESMRLYPPVPIDFKEAVEDDVLPDGTAVRARQRVIYNVYAIGRDPAAWGHGCLEFRPERWMKKGGGFAGGAESPFKYVVFNVGPRLCIGKRFAYTQMKTLAAAVLEAFAVDVAPVQTVKPKLNTTLYMKNGLMVSFRRRETATVTAQE